MKVLLLLPTYPRDKIFRKSMKNLGATLPPLGIAYIAAMLEKYGHEVMILDGPAMATAIGYGTDQLLKDITKFNPEIVGLSASTSQIDHAKTALRIIKRFNKDIITIIGGPLISASVNALNEFSDADYGVYGEADLTFPEILEKIKQGINIEGMEGVIYRAPEGIRYTKPKVVRHLDEIPMPARHLLKMNLYRPSPANYRRYPATTMMTSRGCPYRCIFCSKPTVGQAFRYHSAQRVVDEIEHLIKTYGIKDIQFFDDTFTLLPNRTVEICEGIINRKLDITWNCMTRVDKINGDITKLMARAGCYEMGFGIESGSDRVLKFIKKDVTKDQIRQGIRWAKRAGIDVRGFFMMGFPTETREEILQTIEFAKELKVDVAQFMVSTPFPGTELWEIAKEKGVISKDWNSFTFYAPDQVPFTSELLSAKEIKALYKKAYKDFYLRPSYITGQVLKIRSFQDIYRHWLAAKGILGM